MVAEETKLLDHQVKAVEVIKKRNLILADDVGLGKSVVALASIVALQRFPALVICPAGILRQWVRMAEKWAPGIPVHVFRDGADFPVGDGIEIVSWGLVHDCIEKLRLIRWQFLVIDEAHRMKNPLAERTLAVMRLASRARTDGSRILLLTATHIPNRPRELLTLLQAIGEVHDVDTWSFLHRYCGARKQWVTIRGGERREVWSFDGATNLDQLAAWLSSTGAVIRRTAREAGTALPGKTRRLVKVKASLDSRSRTMFAALHGLLTRIGKGDEDAIEKARPILARLRQRVAAAKVARAVEMVKAIVAKNILIFCWHRATVRAVFDQLNMGGIPTETIVGGDSSAHRQDVVDGLGIRTKVVVATLGAAAEGLDGLQARCHICLVLELDWCPAVYDQAEGRLWRTGQTEAVEVFYLVVPGSVDDLLLGVLRRKRKVIGKVTKDAEREGLREMAKLLTT